VKLNDIFGAINPFQQKATVPNGMINVTSPFADFGGLLAGRTLYPELNQRKFVLDYENNSEVYAIIKRISKTVSTVPFYVYKVKDKKSLNRYTSMTKNSSTTQDLAKAELIRVKAISEIADSPLNDLLEKPNPYQSLSEFIESVIGYKLICGNSFVWANRLESGKVQELVVLPPQYMAIISDGTINGVEGYSFTLVGWDFLDAKDVIHLKYFNPYFDTNGNQLYGLSPLQAAYRTVQRSNDAKDTSVGMLQNQGPKGILYADESNNFGQEEAGKLKEDFYNQYGTKSQGQIVQNAGKILIAGAKLGWVNMGLSPIDLQLLESEKVTLRELCNVYGVNSALFNDPDNKTYNNMKEAKKEMLTQVVLPELVALRDAFNRFFAVEIGNGYYIDFDITVFPELQEDMKELSAILSQSWWITPNEKRAAMRYDTSLDPVMDEVFIPAGYLPIDELTMLQDPTSAQQQGDYNIPPVKNEGFFLSKNERLDEVYSKYKSVTNMGYAELEAWSKTECSKKASLDRAPIERNLRLLSKSKEDWTNNDIEDANRTISFVSRMRGAEQGEPASEGCPSKRDISLKNWAYDPSK
jgi:HK97 family phage portal protein